ncbi:PLP-dependent aminotransferase family protein [Pedobacter antarcticus]|uniref:aminotransferase-like domain-containing protein n=1 Tax=Pedobacter antarcticus TaxID=34086 RepID=UPI002930AE9B|nr:PLP-dependent aminotransferase family protein [Pedobacter antarcticus]
MLPFKNLLVIDKSSDVSIFRQIASQLVLLIQKGTLLPNMELPSTRSLAADLGLHRKTVMAAYNDLIAEDWIESEERKGYKVSGLLPIVKPRTYTNHFHSGYSGQSGFSFNPLEHIPSLPVLSTTSKITVDDGFPETAIFPIEKISKEYKKLLTHPTLKKITSTWNIGGSPNFKDALSSFLNDTRGLNIPSDNLLITRGAQMAIYIAAALILKPGDRVLVTDPNYFMADAVFTQLGAELVRVPVDAEGMDIEAIEDALKNKNIKLLYIIPHHHHPTTVTLSSSRRAKLLELITSYQLPVIEDDYDYDFQYQYSPYLPLASGDHNGNIIYIGSLTKVLGANFRLGYMIATTDFLYNALKLKSLIDLRGDAIMEETVASLIQSGEFSRFIKRANKLYGYRCDYASELINNELRNSVTFNKPSGGMALWLKFEDKFPLAEVLSKSSSLGLRLAGSAYYQGKDIKHNAIRFGFASINEQEIAYAINIIKKVTLS